MSFNNFVANLPKQKVETYLKLHCANYDSDRSDSGKSELDEEYEANRPLPISDNQLSTNSVRRRDSGLRKSAVKSKRKQTEVQQKVPTNISFTSDVRFTNDEDYTVLNVNISTPEADKIPPVQVVHPGKLALNSTQRTSAENVQISKSSLALRKKDGKSGNIEDNTIPYLPQHQPPCTYNRIPTVRRNYESFEINKLDNVELNEPDKKTVKRKVKKSKARNKKTNIVNEPDKQTVKKEIKKSKARNKKTNINSNITASSNGFSNNSVNSFTEDVNHILCDFTKDIEISNSYLTIHNKEYGYGYNINNLVKKDVLPQHQPSCTYDRLPTVRQNYESFEINKLDNVMLNEPDKKTVKRKVKKSKARNKKTKIQANTPTSCNGFSNCYGDSCNIDNSVKQKHQPSCTYDRLRTVGGHNNESSEKNKLDNVELNEPDKKIVKKKVKKSKPRNKNTNIRSNTPVPCNGFSNNSVNSFTEDLNLVTYDFMMDDESFNFPGYVGLNHLHNSFTEDVAISTPYASKKDPHISDFPNNFDFFTDDDICDICFFEEYLARRTYYENNYYKINRMKPKKDFPDFICADLLTPICSQISFFLKSDTEEEQIQYFRRFSNLVFVNISCTVIHLLFCEYKF